MQLNIAVGYWQTGKELLRGKEGFFPYRVDRTVRLMRSAVSYDLAGVLHVPLRLLFGCYQIGNTLEAR